MSRKSPREPRRGRLRTALRATFAVAWVTALVLALLLLGRELATSERFAIADVRVDGARRAAVADILALAAIPEGANVFRFDAASTEESVQSHPWVKSARVRRELPRAVRIEVSEHVPRALVSLGELYLVDADGAIIKAYEPGDPWSFPVVTGLSRPVVERDASTLAPALDVIEAWSQRSLPELSEVRVHGIAGLAVRTIDGRLVRLGAAPVGAKLQRLEQILSSPQTRNAVSIRLDGERRDDRATIILPRSSFEGER